MNAKWLIRCGLASLMLFVFASLSSNGIPINAEAATGPQGDQPPALPVKVLTLRFTAAPAEPPTIEPAGDTVVFKVNAVGKVTGDLDGTLSERVTQIAGGGVNYPIAPVNKVEPITTFFTIKTSTGTIEGYFWGTFYYPAQGYPDATVRQHGQVLSVTPAYANLYLAEVYYDGVVDFEIKGDTQIPLGDSGTLVIAPR